MRVLVVEDQAELADDIAHGLRGQGIGADVAYDGPTGTARTPGPRFMDIGVPPHRRAPRPVAPRNTPPGITPRSRAAPWPGAVQCPPPFERPGHGLAARASWGPHVMLM